MIALYRRILLLAALLVLPTLTGAQAGSPVMASHLAIYDMSLKSADQSSDIAELVGQMLIEVADVCDGWTLKQRIALTIVNFHGDVIRSYTSFASWESKDGRRFRFEQKAEQDGVLVEELGGEAGLDSVGGAGVVVLGSPAGVNLELAPGTLFPSQHTALLIVAAEAGESFVSRAVFDGTSPDGASQISAFIGPPTTAEILDGEQVEPKVWPIRLAFYGASSAAPEPDVEVGMMLQANGVARHLTLDYDSFAIDGRLDKLEILPAADC